MTVPVPLNDTHLPEPRHPAAALTRGGEPRGRGSGAVEAHEGEAELLERARGAGGRGTVEMRRGHHGLQPGGRLVTST